MKERTIPGATVARLPLYLQCLESLPSSQSTISSEGLAALAGVNSSKVRKDLSYLGSYGVRGVGYDVEHLIHQVRRELGLTGDCPVLIVGAGNLGTALANYGGFNERGFRIAALVDADPGKVGSDINGIPVRHIDDLARTARDTGAVIGIIATPASVAQEVADQLAEAGVRSILNFAPAVLQPEQGVEVRRVDLATELQILSFYLGRSES